ncbi:uncharacterized protein AB675_5197 [Cyphellophora attinorum]|uniref:Uncharacterized protein n=1 Tax=Cyphellophora attinorum TaxID=1664694 RepID=A0A0N1HSZ6_9EURO|nr:uncharacterized protein AB675_5197 [Phialophora attinorum]KPI39503.1 hypothetical protein AB675_5197 [Phialophora attinorum]
MPSMIVSRPSSRWTIVLTLVVFIFGVGFLTYHTAPTPSFLRPAKVEQCSNEPLVSPITTQAPVNGTPRNAIIGSVQKSNESKCDWILDELPEWEPVVYVTDRSPSEAPTYPSSRITPKHISVNQGREAAVYLTYILDNYYNLPDYMIFIHGKRYQIHNDDPMFDSVPTIANLKLDFVKENGYTNLKCNLVFCPNPWVKPELNHTDGPWETTSLYARAWKEFWPDTPLPEGVTGPDAAQFAITREAILQNSWAEYDRMRRWAWRYEPHILTSENTGLVFEYMWHIMFGKEPMYCPDTKECYCKKWGMCDLECERPEWCLGRNWFNPEKPRYVGLVPTLPDNWPEEGMSENDEGLLPYPGWWMDKSVWKNH